MSTPHKYLFIAGLVLFILYIGYIFWYDHKMDIENFESLFKKEGLTDKEINEIKHDDDVWYYKNRSTCIGYSSNSNEPCPKFQWVCIGGKTFGTIENQIKEVSKLIKNNKSQHPDCPLIYEGSD